MIYKKISNLILSLVRTYVSIPDKETEEVFTYGIEIILSTLCSYCLVFIIGLLLQSWISAILFSLFFTVIRLYIGGYHCTSYLKCNATFCGIYILIFFIAELLTQYNTLSIGVLMLLLCGLCIWFWEPVENSHKPMTKSELKKCHKIAKYIYLVDFIVAFVCYCLSPFYGSIATLSLCFAVILMPVGKVMEERRRKYDAIEKSCCKSAD